MAEHTDLIHQLTTALGEHDLDRAVEFYAEDAVIASYDGVAVGRAQIRTFLAGYRTGFDRYELVMVSQQGEAGDLLLWDATIETGAGAVQVANVVTLNDAGLITRHVPMMRGYWGKN